VLKGSLHQETKTSSIVEANKGTNGVAIVLDKKHANCLKSYNTVNDRIITAKLNTKPVTLNIVQVYAPTSTSTDEGIDNFYNDLQSVIDKIPKREICIIMGDFNAKVGEGAESENGIDPFGLGERNERGEMLVSFCQANQLLVTNTTFKQHSKVDTLGYHQETIIRTRLITS